MQLPRTASYDPSLTIFQIICLQVRVSCGVHRSDANYPGLALLGSWSNLIYFGLYIRRAVFCCASLFCRVGRIPFEARVDHSSCALLYRSTRVRSLIQRWPTNVLAVHSPYYTPSKEPSAALTFVQRFFSFMLYYRYTFLAAVPFISPGSILGADTNKLDVVGDQCVRTCAHDDHR